MKHSLLAFSLFGLLPATGSAAILIADNFNDLAAAAGLNGRTPNGTTFVNSVNSAGWVTNSTLLQGNGAGGLNATTSATRFFSIDLGASYFANNPGIYELSLDVTTPLNGTATSTLQLGISSSITTNSSFITNNGAPWLSYSGTGDVAVYGGPAATNQFNTTAATGGTHIFTLKLDTSGPQWTLDALIDNLNVDLNGAAAGTTFTYAANPTTDRYIAIATSGIIATQGTMTVDNFRFAVVPEPTSVVLGLIGLTPLLRRKR